MIPRGVHLRVGDLDVAADAHAVVLMDPAGWHLTPKVKIPGNISIVPIPSESPELNPQENIWQYMRDNGLSNRVFETYDEIVDHCCNAWNKLVAEPPRIPSIGRRDWAHGLCSASPGIRWPKAEVTEMITRKKEFV